MWGLGAWVPFSFFDMIKNALNSVLNAIFNNAFFDKLRALIGEYALIVANAIWTVVYAAINVYYFKLLPLVLMVVDFLESCFNIFAGVSYIQVRESGSGAYKETTLQNLIFTKSGVSRIFWGVSLIALVLLVAFTIVGLLRSSADFEGKRPVGKVMGSAGKAALSFLLVPCVAIAAMELASLVLIQTSAMISGGTPNTVSMGNYIFAAVSQDAADASVIAAFLNGSRSYSSISDWLSASAPVNIFKVHTTVGLLCGALIALFLIMGMLIFIRRMFELVLLFLSAPYFVAAMPLDDGQKFKQWRDMFLGKLVSGFGMVLAIKIYLLLVPIIMSENVRFFSLGFSDSVCKLIFLAGGAFAAYKSHSLLTQIVNFQAAHAESETGMFIGGMVLGKTQQLGGQLYHKMTHGGIGGKPRYASGGAGAPGASGGLGGDTDAASASSKATPSVQSHLYQSGSKFSAENVARKTKSFFGVDTKTLQAKHRVQMRVGAPEQLGRSATTDDLPVKRQPAPVAAGGAAPQSGPEKATVPAGSGRVSPAGAGQVQRRAATTDSLPVRKESVLPPTALKPRFVPTTGNAARRP